MIIENQQNINTKKHHSISNDVSKISNIFNREINISIWKRNLNSNVLHASEILLTKNSDFQFSELVNKNFSIDFLVDKISATLILQSYLNRKKRDQ